jgi:hypothetical protein
MSGGNLRALAIFDKPDPLDGPFFEETIYVTPSREHPDVQAALVSATRDAVRALGLTDGPVHAEMRYNAAGAWMLEVAARPIGGLCSRALQFDSGVTLEDVIIRHALRMDDPTASPRITGASGVMMIPIPRAGVYQDVSGVESAGAEVIITAKQGQKLVPLPEGSSYLGFIFARGETPAAVEQVLRDTHARLDFRINTALDTFSPSTSPAQSPEEEPHLHQRSSYPSAR